MRATLVLVALCAACSAAVAPPPSRALCYALADLRAQARVDRECRAGDAGTDISTCATHDDILAQLQREQEACQ